MRNYRPYVLLICLLFSWFRGLAQNDLSERHNVRLKITSISNLVEQIDSFRNYDSVILRNNEYLTNNYTTKINLAGNLTGYFNKAGLIKVCEKTKEWGVYDSSSWWGEYTHNIYYFDSSKLIYIDQSGRSYYFMNLKDTDWWSGRYCTAAGGSVFFVENGKIMPYDGNFTFDAIITEETPGLVEEAEKYQKLLLSKYKIKFKKK